MKVLLSEFNFFHIELPYSTNGILLVNFGGRLSLCFRQYNVNKIL